MQRLLEDLGRGSHSRSGSNMVSTKLKTSAARPTRAHVGRELWRAEYMYTHIYIYIYAVFIFECVN